MDIVLRLSVQEVNGLLNLLSNLPNSSHSYGLMLRIKQQGDEQLQAAQTVAEEPVEQAA